MVLVLPTYRKPVKNRPKPLACPTVKGDLLADARALRESGHFTAAAMTARVEIERLVTTLAMAYPEFGEHWLGIYSTAHWLKQKRVIRKGTLEKIIAASCTGNAAAHGKEISSAAVGVMFNAIDVLRNVAKAKGGAV
jgi:hypothetical protein